MAGKKGFRGDWVQEEESEFDPVVPGLKKRFVGSEGVPDSGLNPEQAMMAKEANLNGELDPEFQDC